MRASPESFLEGRNFEKMEEDRLPSLLDALRGEVLRLSLEREGCRLVQHALEMADDKGRIAIVEELRGNIPEVLDSQHGNHVLQRAIELMRPAAVRFALEELRNRIPFDDICRHRFGCRVLERFIEHFPPEALRPLFDTILAVGGELCCHPYGNFVMQHILEHGELEQKRQIVQLLQGNLEKFAVDAHACSVLDKAMIYSPLEDQKALNVQMSNLPSGLVDSSKSKRCGQNTSERLSKSMDSANVRSRGSEPAEIQAAGVECPEHGRVQHPGRPPGGSRDNRGRRAHGHQKRRAPHMAQR